jgi:hypothetical protein
MDLLDLPVCEAPVICQNCGSTDFDRAKHDWDGNPATLNDLKFLMCEKCPGVPEDWDPSLDAH